MSFNVFNYIFFLHNLWSSYVENKSNIIVWKMSYLPCRRFHGNQVYRGRSHGDGDILLCFSGHTDIPESIQLQKSTSDRLRIFFLKKIKRKWVNEMLTIISHGAPKDLKSIFSLTSTTVAAEVRILR